MTEPVVSPEPLKVPPRSSPIGWLAGIILSLLCLGPLAWLIMIPVFQQTSNSTQTKLCLENLKQIGAAMAMYANDNHDHFPPSKSWMDKLNLYVDSEVTFACPVQRRVNPSSFGYAMNKDLPGTEAGTLKEPAKTPLVFDSSVTDRNAESDLTTLPEPGRHQNGRKNGVLFADGHTDAIGKM